MKNKNLVYLLVLVVLLGVAGWLISKRNSSGTLDRKQDYAFTIQDTASIDRIIIKDKTPSQVVLHRTDGYWVVNDEFRARKDAINTLLETLNRMQMRNFIEEKMKPTVLKRMAVHGKEVQIYKDGKLFKTFFVGTETHDEMATYMMNKGSDAPFAVHIPGFNGYLSSRFFTKPELWRSRDVTLINPRSVREVQMVFPDSLNKSFRITVFSPDSLYLTNLETEKVVPSASKVKMRIYVTAASQMKYEGAILPTDPIYARRDSLLASTPVFYITVKDVDGKSTRLEGYKIKGPEELPDPTLEVPEFDPDRLHGFIDRERMVLIQYYGLQHVFKPIDYFLKP